MTAGPRYQPYLDVPARPFRWRLGVRPLDLADWLEIDDSYHAEIAQKHQIMAQHPETAFQVLNGIESEAAEVFDAIVEHLRHLDDCRLGEMVVDPALHPLDAAARLVQEDLVLMVERDGQLICGGGSVCFPNRWDLAAKVGKTMAEVHAPVARLNDELEAPIDGFLERLTPGRSFWRLGWGVLDTNELYQPTDGTSAPRPAAARPADHFLRVERETLRRFPHTGCVLFTIRTHLTPLTGIPRGVNAEHLADAIIAIPADVAEYKELHLVGGALAAWLRQPFATTSVQ